MLYLVLWKLPKTPIFKNTNKKDMAYVLMKVVHLVKGLLATEGTH